MRGYLLEANVVGVFTEAASAKIQVVFADKSRARSALTAKKLVAEGVAEQIMMTYHWREPLALLLKH